jgi:hypothetical protein
MSLLSSVVPGASQALPSGDKAAAWRIRAHGMEAPASRAGLARFLTVSAIPPRRMMR